MVKLAVMVSDAVPFDPLVQVELQAPAGLTVMNVIAVVAGPPTVSGKLENGSVKFLVIVGAALDPPAPLDVTDAV
jgi:hypothetical protein